MPSNTIKIENKRTTKIVAHRGASGLERENTCAAFVAAGNRSYFGIECDIYPTVDGKFVVFHDSKTTRIGIDTLVIKESTYETLRSLKLTDLNGERCRNDLRIADLDEYLSICKHYEKTAVLELKSGFDEEKIKNVLEIIESYDYLSSVIFISFYYEQLVIIRELCPEAKMQFLKSNFDDDLIEKLKAYSMDLDIDYNSLSEERIALCHENGIKVNCWTVDDPATAEKLISWGVDYITSNILE